MVSEPSRAEGMRPGDDPQPRPAPYAISLGCLHMKMRLDAIQLLLVWWEGMDSEMVGMGARAALHLGGRDGVFSGRRETEPPFPVFGLTGIDPGSFGPQPRLEDCPPHDLQVVLRWPRR